MNETIWKIIKVVISLIICVGLIMFSAWIWGRFETFGLTIFLLSCGLFGLIEGLFIGKLLFWKKLTRL